MCHAPGYRRTVAKDGERVRVVPAEGVDVVAAARAVRRPTSEMCQRCHLGAGGGPNAKHGVAPTSAEADVHVAKGLACVDCHPTTNHRTAGGADIKAHELPEVAVTCTSCHGAPVHRGANAAILARHAARIACQTCHIPSIARDPNVPTVTHRDWTKPVLSEKTGLYGPANTVATGVAVPAAARAVGKPASEMCQRCHLGAGGGPNAKHGVAPTSAEVDVHVAKGLACVDCHTTRHHRIAGGADIKAQEVLDVQVTCAGCHEGAVHKGPRAKVLARHAERIACQTCHIPAIARDPKFPTVVRRDWMKPVLSEKTGLYGPTNELGTNLRPVYRWWNRKMAVPPEPLGSREDATARIYPWKRATYNVVADAATKKAVYIKAGLYAVKGDPLAAARKGAEDARQEFSGAIAGEEETMLFSLNHQVGPKGQALSCDACHGGGQLDFAALGYPEKRVRALERAVVTAGKKRGSSR